MKADRGMEYQFQQQRAKEEEANILKPPIGLLLMKEMVPVTRFVETLGRRADNMFGPGEKQEAFDLSRAATLRMNRHLSGTATRWGHVEPPKLRHDIEGSSRTSKRFAELFNTCDR